MAIYQLTIENKTIILNNLIHIPMVESNRDYRKYLAWLAEGNIPDPADLPPEPTQEELNRAQVLDTFKNNHLHGLTPDEINAYVTDEINSWTTLAKAKTGLLKLLPIMAQLLAWLVVDQE